MNDFEFGILLMGGGYVVFLIGYIFILYRKKIKRTSKLNQILIDDTIDPCFSVENPMYEKN
jgi:cbb3-type cytochrome oxidase subunit 3